MKIEGLGQYNPQTSINASRQVSEEASFSETLQKAYDEQDKAKIKEACVAFETIMLKNLYTQMKATVMKSGLTEESNAREMFQDMLDDELMKQGAIRGTGIAEMMYKQITARMDRMYKPVGAEQQATAEAEADQQTASEIEAGQPTAPAIEAEAGQQTAPGSETEPHTTVDPETP